MLGPAPEEQIVLRRDQCYYLEHMIRANDMALTNGALAAWMDGRL